MASKRAIFDYDREDVPEDDTELRGELLAARKELEYTRNLLLLLRCPGRLNPVLIECHYCRRVCVEAASVRCEEHEFCACSKWCLGSHFMEEEHPVPY